MHIFVGSTNPVKLGAVKSAISDKWPSAVIQGYEVSSGVSAQPRSDEETRQGAGNRAAAVLKTGLLEFSQEPAFLQDQSQGRVLGIGLEGGVVELDGELWSTVWVTVCDEQGQIFEANGARFKLPHRIADPIKAGAEMGPVMNQLCGGADIRHSNGMIGVVTKDYVNRTEEYANLAKLAVGLWYGREWEQTLPPAST